MNQSTEKTKTADKISALSNSVKYRCIIEKDDILAGLVWEAVIRQKGFD